MAEFTFACPSCQQNIACDELWSGHSIQCPVCNNSITVPARPQASSIGKQLVATPGSTKLALGAAPSKQAAAAGQPERVIPIRNLAPEKKKKENAVLKYLKVAVVLAALGVGGYYGYGFLADYQKKVNEKREAEAKAEAGGQAAAPANTADASAAAAGAQGAAAADGSATATNAPDTKLPIVPAVYTLELNKAKIPEGRVNGSLSGTNFLPELSRIDQIGTAQVLRFTEGSPVSPDREILIYLHLKAGEKVSGQKVNITSDMKGAAVPQVSKRWKSNPKYAPLLKSFAAGYAMKLELGQATNGFLPGKIYLALPDNEQSVIAGLFNATGGLVEAASPDGTGTTTEAAPQQRTMSPEFQRRYGIKR